MSFVWRRDTNEKQNPKLFSPFVRRMLHVSNPVLELEELPLKQTEKENEDK